MYLKGHYFFNRPSKEGLEQSIAYFEQAIAHDPHYALAYAGVAEAYRFLPWYTGIPPQEAYARAETAAAKALELDETLAEAHATMGDLQLFSDWDWSGGASALQRALVVWSSLFSPYGAA